MSLFRRMSLSRSVASENSDRRLKKTRTKRSPWELNPLEPRVYLTFSPAMSGLYPTQEGSTYALYLSNTGNERAVETGKETEDPELGLFRTLDRAADEYRRVGKPDSWIALWVEGIVTRKQFVEALRRHPGDVNMM